MAVRHPSSHVIHRTPAGTRVRRTTGRLLALIQQYPWFILPLAIAILIGTELWLFGAHPRDWDYMLLSGWLLVAIGIWQSIGIDMRFTAALDRLVTRGALVGESLPNLLAGFLAPVRRWSVVCGLMLSIVVGVAYFSVIWPFADPYVDMIELMSGIGGGFIVGWLIGRILRYGTFGSFVNRSTQIHITVEPRHIDGAAGLKPLGDFYFFQAILLALPVLHLSIWSGVIILSRFDKYERWREPYLGLLSIAILFETLAFVLPMVSIHNAMLRKKREFLRDADILSRDIADLSRRLVTESNTEKRALLRDLHQSKLEQHDAIEGMPTWPVDVRARRRFTLGNLVLAIPLIGDMASLSEYWQA